jgi:integrase
MRAELARGNWGIFEKKQSPVLADFLKKEFLPYADSTAEKQSTASYYHDGAKRLLASDLASLRLEQITDQHAGQFASRLAHLSPSTINCGLRTLRRALRLAFEWGKLERMPKINLAKGERQRERVLTDDEATRYLAACPQPWRDVATIILGAGTRPGEVYGLRWEHVLLNGHGGLIRIVEGKSRAARRILPMVPEVYGALKARHDAQGKPGEGWVFPSGSRSGHLEESSAKKYHATALAALAKAHKDKPEECPEVERFEPYCLRHTALTNLSGAGCDAFTLARIAGHSSIQITMRYCHPQADAIERAFVQMANRQEVVTDGGQCEKEGAEREAESEALTLTAKKG